MKINGLFIDLTELPVTVNSAQDILGACIVGFLEVPDSETSKFQIHNGDGSTLNVFSYFNEQTRFLTFSCKLNKEDETAPGPPL